MSNGLNLGAIKSFQPALSKDSSKAYANESIKANQPQISFKPKAAPKDYDARAQYYKESSGFDKGSRGDMAYARGRSEGHGKIASFFGGLAEAFKYFD